MKRKILLGLLSMFVVITAILFISRDRARAEVANDITSGLELQWKLNEDPGNFYLTDTSSNHNTGTLYNTDVFTSRSTDVPYQSGSNSHSLYLNSTDTNDYAQSNADVPDSASSTLPRSLCGWIKPATTGGTQVAFNYGSQTVGGKFGIYSSGGRWWFWGFSSADLETTAVPDTSWHHHCVTYDGDILTYYYDGVSVGSASRSLDTTTSTRLIIGQRDADDWMQPMLGRVDDVRIYSRPLNQLEVKSLANLRSVSIDSKPAAASSDTHANFEFSSTGTVVLTTCSIDGSPPASCTSPYTSAPLSEGPHSFAVNVTYDDASTGSDSYNWVVDTTPANTMITRLGPSPIITPNTSFVLTSNETATFECNLDGGGFEACDASYTTPSLEDGEHTLIVRATDAAGNVDPTPAIETWTVDTSTVDVDGDGIYDAIENAGPNNGDANLSGVPDSLESNVASFVNPYTLNYQLITADNCDSISGIQINAEQTKDAGFDYPFGIASFTVQCAEPGMTAQIDQEFFGVAPESIYTLRKFQNSTYNTIEGFILRSQRLSGQNHLRIDYEITDGGQYDEDGEANSVIVDPTGVGTVAIGAPNTGL